MKIERRTSDEYKNTVKKQSFSEVAEETRLQPVNRKYAMYTDSSRVGHIQGGKREERGSAEAG